MYQIPFQANVLHNVTSWREVEPFKFEPRFESGWFVNWTNFWRLNLVPCNGHRIHSGPFLPDSAIWNLQQQKSNGQIYGKRWIQFVNNFEVFDQSQLESFCSALGNASQKWWWRKLNSNVENPKSGNLEIHNQEMCKSKVSLTHEFYATRYEDQRYNFCPINFIWWYFKIAALLFFPIKL